MIKIKRKIKSLILTLIMIVGSSSIAYGAVPAKATIVINGKEIFLEKESFISKDGVLMLPVRAISQELGYKVNWDSQDKSTRLVKEGQEILLETKNKSILKDGTLFIHTEQLSSLLPLVLGWNSKTSTLNIKDIKDLNKDLFKMSKDELRKEKLDEYMQALVTSQNFHGSVLVAEKGEILLKEGYGYADFNQKIHNKSQTRFPIGSVTKQFTAQALLNLYEKGLLNLEDTVSKYISDIPRGDEITIHHLLTHTSGLKNYTDLPEFLTVNTQSKDPMKMLELVKNMDLDFNPGESFNYSNTNYLLAGIIAEQITGQDLAEVLDEITSPLNMEDTGIIGSQQGSVNDATPYVGYLEVMEIDDDIVLCQAYGAGSMYSTVEDLYKWDRTVKSKQMIKEHVAMSEDISYGYGLMISNTNQGIQIYHGGNTLGSTSYIGNLVEEDITVIILSNSGGYNTNPLIEDLISITLNEDYKMPEENQEVEIKDKDLYDKYIGKYEFINGSYLNIIESDNELYAQATGQGAFKIFPKTLTKFFAKTVEVDIEFILGEDGDASALRFSQSGMEFICNRVEPGEEKEEIQMDPKSYDNYLGEYEMEEGFVISIIKEGDKLYAQLTGQDKAQIYPSSELEFFYKIVDAEISFGKDEEGLVSSLTLHQMGRDMKGKKVN